MYTINMDTVKISEIVSVLNALKKPTGAGQYTVKGLINRLQELEASQNNIIYVQFREQVYPAYGLISYRGDYSELCITPIGSEEYALTVAEFTEKLINIVGETVTGWKGGEFTITAATPVWVDNAGDASDIAPVEVQNVEGVTVILTEKINTDMWWIPGDSNVA